MNAWKLFALGLVALTFILTTFPVQAEEQIDLTTPARPDDRVSNNFKVRRIVLDLDSKRIEVKLVGGGFPRTYMWDGPVAVSLMNQLNTANLSVKSLHKRILERLVADGKLSGTVSGNPD